MTKTPNWPGDEHDRFDRVVISVQITTHGNGLKRADVERLCSKIEKVVRGRSKYRDVSAQC